MVKLAVRPKLVRFFWSGLPGKGPMAANLFDFESRRNGRRGRSRRAPLARRRVGRTPAAPLPATSSFRFRHGITMTAASGIVGRENSSTPDRLPSERHAIQLNLRDQDVGTPYAPGIMTLPILLLILGVGFVRFTIRGRTSVSLFWGNGAYTEVVGMQKATGIGQRHGGSFKEAAKLKPKSS
jgi:hypothetical protein